MTKFSWILCLLGISTSHLAYAQEQTNYLLMGRGFTNWNRSEFIALACITEDCKSARFVHFHDATSSFVGDTIQFPDAPTPDLQKKANDVILEEFFFTHHTLSSAAHIDQAMINRGILGVIPLTLAGYLISTAGVGAVPAILVIAAASSVSMNTLSSPKAMNNVVSGKQTTVSLSDQNHWNWSTRPKRLKTKTFTSLSKRIQHGGRLKYYSVTGSYDRDSKMEKSIIKRKSHLTDQGVRFMRNNWGY